MKSKKTIIEPISEGIKYDSEKPDYSLIPPYSLDEMVKVLTHGQEKYSRDNWRKLKDGKNRYFAAAQRHMWAMMRGEKIDPDSGFHHAAHAMCCLFFYYEMDMPTE